MSMQDPIADMLTRMRNGQMSAKETVRMPFSTKKVAILKVLQTEGYILGYELGETAEGHKEINVHLKYYAGKPVIARIERVSRPGLRVHKKRDELPRILGGLGIAIISTSHGVMTDSQARHSGFGGEVLCLVA